MKGPEKRQGPRTARMPARQLEPRLERLGAAVGEENALGRRPRGQLREALGEVDLRLVIEIGPRHVDELARLVLDGGDHLGVAMTRAGDRDARREIEK